jgi:thiamine-phosphate pyrophosphorylase
MNDFNSPAQPANLPAADRIATLRIVDANLNRVTEGLRVVEEYCRFALNDSHLTSRLKRLRHEVTAIVTKLGPTPLLSARDTPHDVGTAISTPQEFQRHSTADLVQANWQRIQQALRVLEEYLKLLSVEGAEQLELLRYQSYTLAKAFHFTEQSQQRWPQTALYVLLPAAESETRFLQLLDELLAAEVDMIQLRDKHVDDRVLLSRARLLRERTRGTSTLFIMNDRPDLAVLAAADGVHVGQEELSVADVRKIVSPQMLVGVSTHSIEQARTAVLDGANYIGCGPTFSSPTKAFHEFPGLPYLREIAAEISLPAFAIGGINVENVPQVKETGITRIAVSSGILNAPSIRAAAKTFRLALQ